MRCRARVCSRCDRLGLPFSPPALAPELDLRLLFGACNLYRLSVLISAINATARLPNERTPSPHRATILLDSPVSIRHAQVVQRRISRAMATQNSRTHAPSGVRRRFGEGGLTIPLFFPTSNSQVPRPRQRRRCSACRTSSSSASSPNTTLAGSKSGEESFALLISSSANASRRSWNAYGPVRSAALRSTNTRQRYW